MVEELELGPQQTLRVLSSSPQLLELESVWRPGGDPPRTHWHPTQKERFEVLEGALTVVVGDQPPRILRTGDTVVIPPRTAHRMWNAGADVTRAGWRITPAQQTEAMFRRVAAGLNPVTSLLLLWRFRREFRLGTPRGS